MGTKNNPGNFDCYAKAAADEPIFTLRGKDPIAPYLVEVWHATRKGDFSSAKALITAASCDDGVLSRVSEDGYNKLDEALVCAKEMRQWRAENVKD
jgi:hypothetical protein